jgi:hypothetical protein
MQTNVLRTTVENRRGVLKLCICWLIITLGVAVRNGETDGP